MRGLRLRILKANTASLLHTALACTALLIIYAVIAGLVLYLMTSNEQVIYVRNSFPQPVLLSLDLCLFIRAFSWYFAAAFAVLHILSALHLWRTAIEDGWNEALMILFGLAGGCLAVSVIWAVRRRRHHRKPAMDDEDA